MAHHVAKLPACANCHYAFVPGEPDAFCPRCGQQNHTVRLRFAHVVEEFLEGVFHFDGKVFRTLLLLLFQPGELTRRFLAGHRVPYVPPIRLYVFISFVFFFLLSLDAQHERRAVQVRVGPAVEHPQGRNIVLGPRLPFTKAQLDSFPERLTRTQVDSVLRRHHMPATFSARVIVQFLPRLMRLMRLSPEEITHQVLKSFSLLLFILMPLAALLLQVAYRRQRQYYLSHLIFSVHLHCFVFVLLAALLGLTYLPLPKNTGPILALLIPLYLLLALHHSYGQSWGMTALKGALLLIGYGVLLAVGLLAALGLGLSLL